jgi:hypothetical protein
MDSPIMVGERPVRRGPPARRLKYDLVFPSAEVEMKGQLWPAVAALALASALLAPAEEKSDVHCYELRTYIAVPGRLPALNARFRDHSVALLQKHGMKLVGFWTPVDKENVLVYIVEHKSREAAEKSWTEFRADPEWIQAKKASEEAAGGSLTEKVESVFMTPTDYSAMK